jgi:hypothetical protein
MATKLKYEVIAVNDIEVLADVSLMNILTVRKKVRKETERVLADVSLMNILTGYALTANITPPSTHLKVGIEAPLNGHKRPLSNVVFLYPPKIQGLNRLVLSIMVGCIEQPFKRLADSVIGSFNLIHSIAQSLKPMVGGNSLFNGVHHATR